MEQTSGKINALWGNIFSKGCAPGKSTTMDVLLRCRLFRKLSRRELKKVAHIIYDRMYTAGEYLFEKDQPGAAMFIIKRGLIRIVVPTQSGKEVELATLDQDDFVGELALLDDAPRSASAKAVEPTEAIAFYREDLNNLLETNPETASKIFKELAIIIGQRLKSTNAQLSINDEQP
jgi:CRP/FNR family transcriptional regulator, cyclic AMP receptor protein